MPFDAIPPKKKPESPGYFFKTETIDWQYRLSRYIVKDTAIFLKRPYPTIKHMAPVGSADAGSFPEDSES